MYSCFAHFAHFVAAADGYDKASIIPSPLWECAYIHMNMWGKGRPGGQQFVRRYNEL